MAHLHSRRVHIPTLDGGDVAQAQLVARAAPDRHGFQLLDRVELACHTHLHHVQRRLHGTGTLHGVLLAQLGQHGIHVQAQLRQALLRDFDIDLLVLYPKQFNFGHVWHAQQALTHIVGKHLGLGVTEAIRLQRVDHAVHITKVVVEKRPLHTCGQGIAHVANLLAHRIPDVGHIPRL